MPNVPNGVPEQGMGGAADLSALKASPEERSQMRTQLLTQVGLLCAGCGERIRDRGIKMVIDAPGQKPGAVAIAAANFCSQECPHFVEALPSALAVQPIEFITWIDEQPAAFEPAPEPEA